MTNNKPKPDWYVIHVCFAVDLYLQQAYTYYPLQEDSFIFQGQHISLSDLPWNHVQSVSLEKLLRITWCWYNNWQAELGM